MNDRRAPGPLEAAVLAVVAAAGEPVAVSDVQRKLPGSPAYTTVMTTLSRLAGKGALTQARDGRAFRYSLAAPVDAVDDAVAARRMRRLLSDGSIGRAYWPGSSPNWILTRSGCWPPCSTGPTRPPDHDVPADGGSGCGVGLSPGRALRRPAPSAG